MTNNGKYEKEINKAWYGINNSTCTYTKMCTYHINNNAYIKITVPRAKYFVFTYNLKS